MTSKVVLIVWDMPSDENWLSPDNIAVALHAYCPNTNFQVYPEEAIAVKKKYHCSNCGRETSSPMAYCRNCC